MANASKTICNMRCFSCKYPDCINDTDYVSVREQREATARDHLAKWYRKTWAEIEYSKKQSRNTLKRYHQKRMANKPTE